MTYSIEERSGYHGLIVEVRLSPTDREPIHTAYGFKTRAGAKAYGEYWISDNPAAVHPGLGI